MYRAEDSGQPKKEDEWPGVAEHAPGQARTEPGAWGHLFMTCTLGAQATVLAFYFSLFSWKVELFRSSTINTTGLIDLTIRLLNLVVLLCKMGVVGGLTELIHVNYLGQCLAHYKPSKAINFCSNNSVIS